MSGLDFKGSWNAFVVAMLASNPGASNEDFIIALAVIPPIVVYLLVFVAVSWENGRSRSST
jgi:hypothetical protein